MPPSSIIISSVWIAASIASLLFCILDPLALAIFAHRRLAVSWKYFGFGALIFFIFQIITRVPLIQVFQAVFAPQLKASHLFLYLFLVVAALTAGLFEEVGRYLGYRWFMGKEEKTWPKAIMYGIGHGGLESIVLVAGLGALSLVNILVISSLGLDLIPAAQRAQVAQQLHAVAAQPGWFPLLGGWERLWTLPVHIALSVVVLQVFRRGQMRWLAIAILAHALLDGVAVFIPQVMGPGTRTATLVTEGVIALFGLAALWTIFALRDHPTQTPVVSDVPSSAIMPAQQADSYVERRQPHGLINDPSESSDV